MNIHWKIFNVLNLICLVLVVGYFGFPFITRFEYASTRENSFYISLLFFLLTVGINCLHNISLSRMLAAGKKMGLGRKIFFWIMLTLFAFIAAVFTYLAIVQFEERLGNPRQYRYYYNMRSFIQVISIAVTSIYVTVMQIILFFKISGSYKQEIEQSINEIGTE
jgi:hypothetical protein